MAMPADYAADGGVSADEGGGRAATPDDYKRTCIDFVEDISGDYKAWVDYYRLPAAEDKRRRTEIDATIARTCEWIAHIATSIKSIDVVMNDGIQKMAESTAGRPFAIGVFVNGMSGYTRAKPGVIRVNVKASGREGRQTALGFHFQDDRFRIESTCGAYIDEGGLASGSAPPAASPGTSAGGGGGGGGRGDLLDVDLVLHAEDAAPRDVISFTVTVVELRDGVECDKRGVTTAVHIT